MRDIARQLASQSKEGNAAADGKKSDCKNAHVRILVDEIRLEEEVGPYIGRTGWFVCQSGIGRNKVVSLSRNGAGMTTIDRD